MSAIEVRELARVVINAGGDLDDLKRLVARWEAGAGPAVERTVADLSDEELLAVFPGSTVKHVPESESAPCGCRHPTREWRLRGEGADVSYTRASGKALHEATAAGRGVLRTGKRSGWTYRTTPTGRGHPWICALCHPPAEGLDFETRDLTPTPKTKEDE